MKTNNRFIAVVGGINIDICSKAFRPLISRDSNPGTVRLSLGGVGRNIAHNLCLLGADVAMLTALGDDLFTKQIEDSCASVGIDLRYAVRVPGGSTSTYAFIAEPEGDMALAVCDAQLSDHITPEYLMSHMGLLNQAAAVVLETNPSPEALACLAEHCTSPLFADPVSVSKAEKLKPILGKLHTLKPNRLEAEFLSGVKITDRSSLELAAKTLLNTGLKRVFISLGGDGLYCAAGEERVYQPCPPTTLVNATGGGDALMAALTRAFCLGMDLASSAKLALAASSIAVESKDTINGKLSLQSAMDKAGIVI